MLIVTGKKVRYAAITATDCQPAFSQTTTIGATARIGIVCDATMYGSSARCASRECTSPTASANPTTAPIAKPASASFAVNHAALSSTVIRSGPWERDGSPSALRSSKVGERRVVDRERPRPAGRPPRPSGRARRGLASARTVTRASAFSWRRPSRRSSYHGLGSISCRSFPPVPSPTSRSCASSPATTTAPSGSPGPRRGSRRVSSCERSWTDRRGRGDRPGGQPVVHAARAPPTARC